MDRKWIPESEQSIKIGRVYTQVARNQERRRKADMLPMTHQNSVHLFKTHWCINPWKQSPDLRSKDLSLRPNKLEHNNLGVVHKGRPQKWPLFISLCPQVSAFDHSPLQTSAFSIIYCPMVWQRNSWCCQNTLLVDIIRAFYSYPTHVGWFVGHVINNFTPGMLILVLVLKDSLRTFFKSLSLSWSLGVRSLSWSLGSGPCPGPYGSGPCPYPGPCGLVLVLVFSSC